MRFVDWIRSFWVDEFIPYDDKGPLQRVGGFTKRSLLKRIVSSIFLNVLSDWRFWLGISIGLASLYHDYFL